MQVHQSPDASFRQTADIRKQLNEARIDSSSVFHKEIWISLLLQVMFSLRESEFWKRLPNSPEETVQNQLRIRSQEILFNDILKTLFEKNLITMADQEIAKEMLAYVRNPENEGRLLQGGIFNLPPIAGSLQPARPMRELYPSYASLSAALNIESRLEPESAEQLEKAYNSVASQFYTDSDHDTKLDPALSPI